MRCCLIAVLFTAAVFPPLIAAAFEPSEGTRGAKLKISSFSSDKDIRRKLLEHTPPGMSAVDVLSFGIDTLRPSRPIYAHSGFKRAYEASTGKKADAIPTSAKTISVTVAERLVALLSSEHVRATWHFDENDRLTDITIERITIGP